VFLDKLELANSKMGTALQARRDGLGFCQQSKTKSHEISAADRGLRYQIASLHGEGGVYQNPRGQHHQRDRSKQRGIHFGHLSVGW